MAGNWPPQDFPNLTGSDYEPDMSRATNRYNCIAWAAGNTTQKWWPDRFGIGYWPPNLVREETVAAFVRAYGTLGYVPCADSALEAGIEKIALFVERGGDGEPAPTHAAIQLENGHWSSKLGDFEDITHFTLECLQGPLYGSVHCLPPLATRFKLPAPSSTPAARPLSML
jgi:hypothetical protein